MTDTNIIHALQCCGVETNCRNCPLYEERSSDCIYTVLKNALDLITRLQAEKEELVGNNDKLNIELQSMRSAANSLKMHYEEAQAEIESLKIFRGYAEKRASDYRTMRDKYLNAKSEAVKECLAKVKNYIKTHCNPYGKPDFDYDTSIKILNFIDKLAKEMVGDDNA